MNPPERPFDHPWQAQAFALVVALHERGHFSWAEWAQALGAALQDAAPDGSDYYERWLMALEALLAARGQTDHAEIAALAARWQEAAHATPHGRPIELDNAPG